MLDLCAADRSHLPPGLRLREARGLGMSDAELAANPQLTGYTVQDLNRQPRLGGLADASLDAVLCACGVQYLTQPEAVLAEVGVVLAGDALVAWQAALAALGALAVQPSPASYSSLPH